MSERGFCAPQRLVHEGAVEHCTHTGRTPERPQHEEGRGAAGLAPIFSRDSIMWLRRCIWLSWAPAQLRAVAAVHATTWPALHEASHHPF